MLILALDTSTLVSSIALAEQDTLVGELTLQTTKTHSEMLMPHIAELLTLAQIDRKQVGAVAVSLGPGSFTGLRIGLATAKALAYAWKIPVIGVSTLEAMAQACPVPGIVLSPMLDAQKGNVYQALYRWDKEELREVMPARVVQLETAIQELGAGKEPVLMLGEGAVMCRAVKELPENIMIAPPHIIMPRAGTVAILGHKLLGKGIEHDAMTLEPVYIRRSEAEELWERRNQACQ